MVQDVDFIIEIKDYIEAVMKKFNNKKMNLLAGVRAEINYQVGLKVNIVIQELNRLKEVVRIDMKKWST